MPIDSPVPTGQLVGRGRFEVLRPLGRGSGGLVYAVRDRETEGQLALKTVNLAGGADALAALKREFRAVQDLAHPNLVRLDELFEENGVWFFTMELIDGVDWLSYVRKGARVGDPHRVRASAVQIVDALSVLHAAGILHRDVKPPNVLVSDGGQVKLLDFGIAARKGTADDEASIAGTLHYMAPEQILATELGPACDFYALGVMLREALTGRFPFSTDHTKLIREKLEGPAPAPMAEEAPTAPPGLAALCDALLQTDPEARPDALTILRGLGAEGHASSGTIAVAEELVGREAQARALREAFDDARKGSMVVVAVEGASGIGKSALVRHFVRGLKPKDAYGETLVLEGRCHEREYVPYNGLDAIVDALAEDLAMRPGEELAPLSTTALRLLPRLFPALNRVDVFAAATDGALTSPGALPSAEGAAHELRARTFQAFRELLAIVAARRTVVLFIDDIQWADGDTMAMLSDVLAPPAPAPLLLIFTRRAAEETNARETPDLPGDVRRVRLTGLSAGELSELASHLSRAAPLERTELASLAAESGGHPLFLQELVRARMQEGTAARGMRLDDALHRRVTLLGERERRVVEAVVVAAVPTDIDVVAAASAIDRRERSRILATLVGANLVKMTRVGARRCLEPFHDRVREAVASRLDADGRRAWHELLARALEERPERDLEQVARHWEGAGDAPRASSLLREAGDRASGALAFDRAADLYQRALALTARDVEARPALLLSLADALQNAGRGADAARSLLAVAESRTDGADDEGIDLRTRAADALLCSGHYAEGIDVLRGVIREMGLWLPRGRWGAIFRIVWCRLLLRLRGTRLGPRAVAGADPRAAMRVDVCWAAAHAFGMTDATIGVAWHALGLRLALDLGDPLRAARALAAYAPLPVLTEGAAALGRSRALVREAREMSRGLTAPYVRAFASVAEGIIAWVSDDFRAAEGAFVRAEEGFRDHCVGVSYELGATRTLFARVLAHFGRIDRIAPYAGAPLRDAVRRKDRLTEANLRSTAAVVTCLARGDVPGADREAAAAAAALSDRSFQLAHFYWLVARCSVELYRGAATRAIECLDEHRGAVAKALLDRGQWTRVTLLHLEGRAYLAAAAQERSHPQVRAWDPGRRAPGPAARPRGLARGDGARIAAPGAARRLRRGPGGGGPPPAERYGRLRSPRNGAIRRRGAPRSRESRRRRRGDRAPRGRARPLRAQGIAEPVRFAGMFAPGFPEPEVPARDDQARS